MQMKLPLLVVRVFFIFFILFFWYFHRKPSVCQLKCWIYNERNILWLAINEGKKAPVFLLCVVLLVSLIRRRVIGQLRIGVMWWLRRLEPISNSSPPWALSVYTDTMTGPRQDRTVSLRLVTCDSNRAHSEPRATSGVTSKGTWSSSMFSVL